MIEIIKILFSPVGKSDPVSHNRDSALLHIVRVIKPTHVYLFETLEITDRNINHTYEMALKSLAPGIEVIELKHPEVDKPNKFGVCDNIFEQYLINIWKNSAQPIEIIINLSSGTPQMQASLLLVASQLDFHVKLYQVDIDEKNQIKKSDNSYIFKMTSGQDILNESYDSIDSEFQDRTRLIEYNNIKHALLIKAIEQANQSYDYDRSIEIIELYPSLFDNNCYNLIRKAQFKYHLNLKEAKKIKSKFEFFPIAHHNELFDYLLYMQSKLELSLFDEFSRALTPVLLHLYNEAIINVTKRKINVIEKYTINIPFKAPGIDFTNLEQDLSQQFLFTSNDYSLSSKNLKIIYESLCEENDFIKALLSDCRNYEIEIRNLYAHNLVSMTAKEIKQRVGFTPKDLMEKLKNIFTTLFPDIRKQINWNLYHDINDEIKNQMKGEKHG
ncbi:MAG TPA: hypothetical protein PLR26_07020 [Bacilli bacterium]|nr:hypothetical protein [Bacilli bacterium]